MAVKHFVSEAIVPASAAGAVAGEPQLPASFTWRDEVLQVERVVNAWRSTKEDRGDVYLKRHWFEFETSGGRRAIVYFDRGARPGAPRWWLYTIEE